MEVSAAEIESSIEGLRDPSPGRMPAPVLYAIPILLSAGLILPFALVHVDDADGSIYTVVARHLVEDGTPFQLRFLKSVWPAFYEHPPLLFWIQALLITVFGTGALAWFGALCGIGTV